MQRTLGLVSVVLSMGTVCIVGLVVYEKTRKLWDLRDVALLLAVIGGALTSGVGLLIVGVPPQGVGPVQPIQILVGRGVTVLMIAAFAYAVASSFGEVRKSPATSLWLAALTFLSVALAVELIGRRGRIEPLITMIIFVLTAVIAPSTSPHTAIRTAKWLITLVLIASASAAVAFPSHAWLEHTAGSFLPGIDHRLAGVVGHPNALGMYCALYLALELMCARRLVHTRFWATVAVSTLLVLSQSKSAITAALLVGIVAWMRQSRHARRNTTLLVGALGIMLGTFLATSDFTVTFDISSLRNLTGRTTVWQYGLQQWGQSPWLGAGSDAFTSYAATTGNSWAAQSHNQFIETVVRHGLLGLIALVFYLSALGRFAWKMRYRTNWASLALTAVLFSRLFTETPLRVLGPDHAVLFLLLLRSAEAGGSGTSTLSNALYLARSSRKDIG